MNNLSPNLTTAYLNSPTAAQTPDTGGPARPPRYLDTPPPTPPQTPGKDEIDLKRWFHSTFRGGVESTVNRQSYFTRD